MNKDLNRGLNMGQDDDHIRQKFSTGQTILAREFIDHPASPVTIQIMYILFEVHRIPLLCTCILYSSTHKPRQLSMTIRKHPVVVYTVRSRSMQGRWSGCDFGGPGAKYFIPKTIAPIPSQIALNKRSFFLTYTLTQT